MEHEANIEPDEPHNSRNVQPKSFQVETNALTPPPQDVDCKQTKSSYKKIQPGEQDFIDLQGIIDSVKIIKPKN